MTTYSVHMSDLTNTIYAGRVNKSGTAWADKSDVTEQALIAVAQHVLAKFSGSLTLRAADGSGWDIDVTEIKP